MLLSKFWFLQSVQHTFSFISCPDCKVILNIERIGPVGEIKIPDSDSFRCNDCNITFRAEGETWKEAHGSIRSWP